ncbi:MAG: transcriptional repressor [Clostridia bacterium]|jgi:Fe2+ or Zn2+ uptake regulation protein|nr:transcriptional repressor [Clostridia bacterium]
MTKEQKAILDTVLQSSQHLSADEVYWRVKQQYPSIALGTIYRNLNRFADSKLIRRVARPAGADYFEGNVTPHDHAVCIRCGQMMDLKIPKLQDFLKSQMNCDIVSFDLTVNYICPECAQKETGKA